MIALFLTVGTSDLQAQPSLLNRQPPLPETYELRNGYHLFRSALEDGKILADNHTLDGELVMPMVSAAIGYVQRQLKGEKIVVILVCTKQVDPHRQDTFYFGKVIDRKIRKDYGQAIADINTILVTDNVINLDVQFRDFNRRVADIKNHASDFNQIYVQAQGGIDAINTALVNQLIINFPKNHVQLLYKPEGNRESIPSNYPVSLKNSIDRIIYQKSLDQYDYLTLRDHDTSQMVGLLARAAHARIDTDFEGYRRQMRELADLDRDNAPEIGQLSDNLPDKLDLSVKLKEWYVTIKISVHQGSNNLVLLKAFSWLEQLMLNELAAEFGFVVSGSENENKSRLYNSLESRGLFDKLNDYTIVKDGRTWSLKYQTNIDRGWVDINLSCLKAYLNVSGVFGKKPGLFELVGYWEVLHQLRNRIAHGLESPSLSRINATIDAKFPGKDLNAVLKFTDEYLGVVGMQDYDRINRLILKYL